MIKVVSVNISEKKGTIKTPQPFIILDHYGVKGDAHAGPWQRQVSLLGTESITKFSGESGRSFAPGEFAENITTEGILLYQTRPLDRFVIGNTVLEVTQIGKGCHGDGCAIFREIGNCVMPKEGIFCRVLQDGMIKPGDLVIYKPYCIRVMIITLSDRASRGEYEDRSGPTAAEYLHSFSSTTGYPVETTTYVIGDNEHNFSILLQKARSENYDLVLTTGGTGIGPRDITPDVTRKHIDKEIPGLMELIRIKYGSEKPHALLSRAVAGLMGNTIVFNMPGSVKAVREYSAELYANLKHMIYMIHSLDLH